MVDTNKDLRPLQQIVSGIFTGLGVALGIWVVGRIVARDEQDDDDEDDEE